MPYAIRRVFDGKLLPLPSVKRRTGMTWVEFDDDVFQSNKHSIPALWPTEAGATSLMKMWRKGGWRKSGFHGKPLTCVPQPDRDKFPVEVVKVELTVVNECTEQQIEAQTRSEKSVLD